MGIIQYRLAKAIERSSAEDSPNRQVETNRERRALYGVSAVLPIA